MIERQVLRGFLANIDVIPPLIVTFQFNPDSISDNKAVNYTDGKTDLCGNAPGKVYTGGGHRTISFDIHLHGLEQSTSINPIAADGISTELAKLRSFLYPKEDAWASTGIGKLFGDEGGKRLTSPPACFFGFGNKILECVMTDMDVQETQFNSFLAPVRAKISITLVVNEEDNNGLYGFDRLHRNLLAAQGVHNISIF